MRLSSLIRGGCDIVHVTLKDGRTLTKRVDTRWEREKPGLGCLSWSGNFCISSCRRWADHSAKNFGPGLVARPAEWCASFDEIG